MADQNLENLDPQMDLEEQTPMPNERGSAIRPKSAQSKGVTGNAAVDRAIDFGKDKTLNVLSGGGWEAAKRLPVVGKMLDELSNKALKYFTKNFWKTLLLANWPTLTTVAVMLGLLLIITVPSFAGISKARRGAYGKTIPVNASVLKDADVATIQELLNGSGIDYAAIRSWRYSQGYKHEAGTEGWATQSYGYGTTVGTSGCGPTSAAMVLKKYGVNVTPADTSQFCLDNGYRIKNSGTSPGCFSALAKKYGLKSEQVSGWEAAKKVLEAGQPLIISVRGPSTFVSGSGHYIVLAGIYGDKVLINDSGPRNKKIATVSEVLGAFKHGYYYIHP